MNSCPLALVHCLLLFVVFSTIAASPLAGNDEVTTKTWSDSEDEEDVTTTVPTFLVQRLNSPIERIEIRLIDDDDHKTSLAPEVDAVVGTMKSAGPEEKAGVTDGWTTTTEEPDRVHQQEQHPSPAVSSSEPPLPMTPTDDSMYKKAEYVVHRTPEPIVIGEDPSYFSTMSSEQDEAVQAKAWMSVAPTIPKFDGDIDEDDLPPPPDTEESGADEPEEECLANKEKLSQGVIEKLQSETTNYYRLIRQRNDQQKEFCGGPAAADITSDLFRRCSSWRAEKLVYYYKLMRKTYCQVDNWPNSPKIKKTYGEYLNLFGTFYAFQK